MQAPRGLRQKSTNLEEIGHVRPLHVRESGARLRSRAFEVHLVRFDG
jgi:hypothetical protein